MRITELPQAASVAQTDDLAIDVPGGRTYRIPRSILAHAPYIATIPTGQWSGSGSDRYITVTASNVTADAMLYPFYDNASAALLNGPVWVIPAAGSFTIHTSAIPSGTVTISVLLAGIVGEAQYQVLADVYSKSQVDTIVAQSTAMFDLTSKTVYSGNVLDATQGVYRCSNTATNKPNSEDGYMSVIVRNTNYKTIQFTTDSNKFFVNTKTNGTWTGWIELQSTANRMLYVDASLTFTNDSSSAKEYEIPLSSYIPSGYVIQGVAACVKSGTAYYVLPWSNNALTQYLNIQRITGTSVWLRNKSDGWGTVTVRLSVAIGKT